MDTINILCLISRLLEFTNLCMYGCGVEIMYVLLNSELRTRLFTSWLAKRLLACFRFSKLVHFQIYPLLNILTVPDWLNFKFNYFLMGQKGKILNT